ncbi:MAG TPA: DUF4410 domain-containing protein [Blastocatellia bacterium]|nr:DUF4410 domain-containing protein [Blastocatellia bacterium]
MRNPFVLVLVLVLAPALAPFIASAQQKPVIVVEQFTVAPGATCPYDMKTLTSQMIAELDVILGKDFDIAAEAPTSTQAPVFTLKTEITEWHSGNAAKRVMIGFGSGRETSDIKYQVADGSGKKVLEKKDTIRTNYFSQGAGSSGTLAHPIALKIAERIKNAKLTRSS